MLNLYARLHHRTLNELYFLAFITTVNNNMGKQPMKRQHKTSKTTLDTQIRLPIAPGFPG